MAIQFPQVDAPDEARQRDLARRLDASVPGRALGRLGAIGAWVAGVQGVDIPHPFTRARAVVVAGNHGIAERGVSAWQPDAARAQAADIAAGGGPVNAAARMAGAGVRLVEDFLAQPTGAIDLEAAMSTQAYADALQLGVDLADEEVDAGTDIVLPGDLAVGNTTVAAALYGTFTRTEPVLAVGRGSGINDEVWKVKAAAVRDAMFRVRGCRDDEERVLAEIAGPDFACLVGLIAQSAVRRTPVVVDGAYVAVAAYVAERLAPGTKRWLIAGQLTPEPSHLGCVQALGLTPVLALDVTAGQAAGALAALPAVNLAAELAAEVLGGA